MGKPGINLKVSLIALAAGVAIGAIVLWLTTPSTNGPRPLSSTVTEPRGSSTQPPPAPPPTPTFQESLSSPPSNQELPQPLDQIPPLILQGNVLNVSAQDQTITIGSYRIEHNKAVLATQQTIGFTDETLFVRASSAGSEQPSETAIPSQDIHEHDPVAIIASRRSAAGQPVAEKIILLGDLAQPAG